MNGWKLKQDMHGGENTWRGELEDRTGRKIQGGLWAEPAMIDPCTHNRRYLQTSRAWRPVTDFKDKPAVFPESSQDIKLAGPDEKPGSPRLQSNRAAPGRASVFTPGAGHRNETNTQVSSRQHGKMYLPEAGMNGEYFLKQVFQVQSSSQFSGG